MATTWAIRSMGAAVLGHPQLSYVAQWEPEGTDQTFTAGAPVYPASGLITAAVDPIDGSAVDNKMVGLAIEDAKNVTKGRAVLTKFIPNIDGVIFYANLLTGDGATNLFAEADLFNNDTETLAAKSGLITSGVTDWFIDNAGTTGISIVSTRADIVVENKPEPEGSRVLVGDSDVRVGFVTTAADRLYGQTVVT